MFSIIVTFYIQTNNNKHKLTMNAEVIAKPIASRKTKKTGNRYYPIAGSTQKTLTTNYLLGDIICMMPPPFLTLLNPA